VTGWLIDKSALVRIPGSPEESLWSNRVDRGLVRISTVTRLEAGFSFRSGADMRAGTSSPPLALMPTEHLTPLMEVRALDIQQKLADRGFHRAPSIPDLLIASMAELAGLTVLHLDKDFDLIAEITGQPLERLTI